MAKLLIVDDEPMVAMLLADWVEDLGHIPLGPAASVATALKLIEADAPDAAIIDVSLGAEKGYPVADALRKLNVPFLFATGFGADDLDVRYKDAPLLTKPFDFEAVTVAVRCLLGEFTK